MSSIFTSMGAAATTSAERVPAKFIKLEDGKSVRIRLASAHDIAEYVAHGAFDLGIYPTPCIAALGNGCPLCTAANAGIEKFKNLYGRQRYLFIFWDLDAQQFLPFDATKEQAKKLLSDIKNYEDALNDTAFTLKRTGTSTSTTYTISPILRLSADDKAKFDAMPETGVTPDMFEAALTLRVPAQMIADLAKNEFPVDQFFAEGSTAPSFNP